MNNKQKPIQIKKDQFVHTQTGFSEAADLFKQLDTLNQNFKHLPQTIKRLFTHQKRKKSRQK